jgi:hypothetical protein
MYIPFYIFYQFLKLKINKKRKKRVTITDLDTQTQIRLVYRRVDSWSEGEGGSPPDSPQSSNGAGGSQDASSASTACSAPREDTDRQQNTLKADIDELAGYLAAEKAPKRPRRAIERIRDAHTRRAQEQTTTDTIQILQKAVKKLATQVEAIPSGIRALGLAGTSYVAANQRGAANRPQSCMQSRNNPPFEPTKLVLARHKR